ncbi:hypothetical protein B1J92_A02299g [Nakaseomyces glabratus]|nr:hypothetical protein B1J91_A02299g [Nakaseomyces glabratus]OXB50658.1 hypothetical protein B1J92_A02299g [Nakaseomyces glabratus]
MPALNGRAYVPKFALKLVCLLLCFEFVSTVSAMGGIPTGLPEPQLQNNVDVDDSDNLVTIPDEGNFHDYIEKYAGKNTPLLDKRSGNLIVDIKKVKDASDSSSIQPHTTKVYSKNKKTHTFKVMNLNSTEEVWSDWFPASECQRGTGDAKNLMKVKYAYHYKWSKDDALDTDFKHIKSLLKHVDTSNEHISKEVGYGNDFEANTKAGELFQIWLKQRCLKALIQTQECTKDSSKNINCNAWDNGTYVILPYKGFNNFAFGVYGDNNTQCDAEMDPKLGKHFKKS